MARRLMMSFAVLAALALVAAACGDSDDTDEADATTTTAASEEPTETTADDGGATTTSAGDDTAASTTAAADDDAAAGDGQMDGDVSVCGLNTGEPATGEPIRLGAMATNVPGIDFTWITGMTGAYFDCVNDNGGIHGRPIEYIAEEEQVDPQQIASLAVKLIEEDQVVGIVGSTSLLDCSVNADYYAEQAFYLIIAGVDHACFTGPNYSAVNMGPYYSSLGGAQAALRAGAAETMVIISPNQPGVELINSGVVDFAEANGLEGISLLEDVPIADPATLALRLVEEAGEGGGVVLDFTGPAVLPLLQAIEQQGLIDSVIWASSTPPNDPSIAEVLSPAWNDKFLINAEFTLLDSDEPDATLLREVRDQYRSDINLSSFGQMGFLAGRIATQALLDMGPDAEYTAETVNEAFRSITNFETDILCKPWYFDSGAGANVSNNTDLTVVPRDGVMVEFEECFEIVALDVEANRLAAIREAEAAGGLNTGS